MYLSISSFQFLQNTSFVPFSSSTFFLSRTFSAALHAAAAKVRARACDVSIEAAGASDKEEPEEEEEEEEEETVVGTRGNTGGTGGGD